MSVYGALFLVENAPVGIDILVLDHISTSFKMAQILVSDRGQFCGTKCAIDRHLSTEGSPKLRLWRLFDPQIYTSVLDNF